MGTNQTSFKINSISTSRELLKIRKNYKQVLNKDRRELKRMFKRRSSDVTQFKSKHRSHSNYIGTNIIFYVTVKSFHLRWIETGFLVVATNISAGIPSERREHNPGDGLNLMPEIDPVSIRIILRKSGIGPEKKNRFPKINCTASRSKIYLRRPSWSELRLLIWFYYFFFFPSSFIILNY